MIADLRYQTYLRARYGTIIFFLGLTWFFIGLALFVPLFFCLWDKEPLIHSVSFILPGLLAVGAGVFVIRTLRGAERVTLSFQEGALTVTLAWLSAFAIGAVPFLVGMHLPFHLALFESTSGWTTTGMSIIDPDSTARSFLFFRSLTEFVGGAGLVILSLSAAAGPMGSSLSAAEGRGEYLVPNVRRSAKLVLTMYVIYVTLVSISLHLAGMSAFDAINHAMVAVSTGGFSTRTDSIAYWDSPLIEAILIGAMIAAAVNFATAYAVVTGTFRVFLRSGEVRVFFVLLFFSILLLSVFAAPRLFVGELAWVRHSAFAAVSAMSGTGLSTSNYAEWGGFAFLIFFILMVVGGGTGSTAAGIKQYRVYAIYRAVVWDFKKMFLPPGAMSQPNMWQASGKKFLSEREVAQISLFVMLYLGLLFVGSCIFLAYGYSFNDSVFEFTSALGNVGLSSGITAPDMPAPLIWLQCIAMLFGRLEIFTVVIGVTKLMRDSSHYSSVTLRQHFEKGRKR